MGRVVRRTLQEVTNKALDDEEWDKRFKKAMLLAKSPGIRLDDSMRHELARMVPGVNSNDPKAGSWKNLTEPQLDVLLNMLEGFALISYLKIQRGDYVSLGVALGTEDV